MIGVDLADKFTNGPVKRYRAVMNPGNVALEVDHGRPQFNNLKAYTNYSFYAQAYSEAGFGPSSEVLFILTGESEPGPPEHLNYVPIADPNLFLRWAAPVELNGLIIMYEVKIFMHNNSVILLSVDPKSISLCETKIPKAAVRRVEVSAVTSQGHRSRPPAVVLIDANSSVASNTTVIVMTVLMIVLVLVIISIIVLYLRRRG